MNASTTKVGDWAVGKITRLLETHGPRPPGSEAEWAAQQDMATQMQPWADDVVAEGFTVRRHAFMGFIPFTVVLTMAASVLFWFGFAVAGLVLITLAAIPLILEFVMYKQFIDVFFKAQPSHNIIATRKAKNEPKKRIYLVGHADSQYEWTLNLKFGGTGMKLVLVPAVVGMVICFFANLLRVILFDVLGLIDSLFLHTLFLFAGAVLFLLFPCMIGFLFFQSRRKSVPGANDNLTGCYVAMSVLRDMAARDFKFDDTEVVVLLTGSEEAGLRGAKAFVKRHREMLRDPNMKTAAIGLDTFRDMEHMAIYNRDLSGTLRHSVKMQELMYDAAKDCGLDLPFSSIYLGACDAAAFTQAGIDATGFAAMDPTPPRYYHTRLDDASMLVPETIEKACEVTMRAVELLDARF